MAKKQMVTVTLSLCWAVSGAVYKQGDALGKTYMPGVCLHTWQVGGWPYLGLNKPDSR